MGTPYDAHPDLRASLQQRLDQVQKTIDEFNARELAHLQGEYELALRLMDEATNPHERRRWEVRADALHELVMLQEDDLERELDRRAYYAAMTAEIEAEAVEIE